MSFEVTNYRGKILIHAGLTMEDNQKTKFVDYHLDYAKGGIIGEADLVDCIKRNGSFNKNFIKIMPLYMVIVIMQRPILGNLKT